MAVKSRASTELLIPRKWSGERSAEVIISPERSRKRVEPKSGIERKVAVIYYLSRNGQLEHPHFIEVPLSSSSTGLCLQDVIDRLNSLRGHGMGNLYSWSSKRSYKNGYVWQDLSEDDLIHPTNGHDYVLKGSELLQSTIAETACSRTNKRSSTSCDKSDEDRDAPSSSITAPAARGRRRNQSWSSFVNHASDDLRREYSVVYKCESSRDFAAAADAATQTEEKRVVPEELGSKSVELSREDLSPPPSMSSSDGSVGVSGSGDVDQRVNVRDSIGKVRALMQLLACGSSTGLKLYGPMKSKESKMKAQLNR